MESYESSIQELSDFQEDQVKSCFKFCKKRKPLPDLSQVLHSLDQNILVVKPVEMHGMEIEDCISRLGLNPPLLWNIHSLTFSPGLFIIRNVFTVEGARFWITKIVKEFTSPPHKTNILSLNDDLSWWEEIERARLRSDEEGRLRLESKLRWATIGFHHNWDSKVYSEENKSPMPLGLEELCQLVLNVIGLNGSTFKAEAGIVNYYPLGTTLNPHTDHSEMFKEAPLLSFSFGQTELFLIGGHNKMAAPKGVLLHNGDIMVMSGLSRLCYHAVPRIIKSIDMVTRNFCIDEMKALNIKDYYMSQVERSKGDINMSLIQITDDTGPCINPGKEDDDDWNYICRYLNKTRMNLNVRQVLHPKLKILVL